MRFPEAVLGADRRLLLVKAWVVGAARRRGATCARRWRAVRELGGLDEGPLPDGFASLALERLRAERGVRVGRRRRGARARARARRSSRGRSRRGGRWSRGRSGWAHYCNGELDHAERWLRETAALAPAAEPVDRRPRGDGGPVADRGHARAACGAAAAGDRGASTWRASAGCSTRARSARSHTAYGVALAAHGRREEALPELEQGVFLRRLWGQPLDLVDGLIALAPAVAAVGDRERARELFGEAEAILARCPDAGVLPARLAAAKRAAAAPARR